MKKFAFIFAAIAASIVVSCTKETPAETPDTSAPAEMKLVTITASVDDTATKTAYTPDGTDPTLLKFSWTKGDQISVLCSDGNFYTFVAAESAASATFSGYIPEGSTLGTYALYPADENHTYDVNNYYPFGFNIPNYKDLSTSPSAYLPMHSESSDGINFQFKHMTGAFRFTIENIDDMFKTVDVLISTGSLKISGVFQVRKSSTHSGYVTYAESTDNKDEKIFKRKAAVVNNAVQVYLPYSPGNDLWGDTTIEVIGYDAEGNSATLLSKTASFGDKSHTRAVIIPVASIVAPAYVPPVDWTKVDWSAENVAIVTNASGSDDAKCEELKVVADEYYMYAWLTCTLETPYTANYIDILLSDGDAEGEGAGVAWDQWPGTKGVHNYNKEHKGTMDSNGNLTSMTFNYNGVYENIEYKTEISNDNINWYLAFPMSYISAYKSEDNKIYVGFRLWTDWNNYAAIPARGYGQSMLEVTLP